MSPVGISLTIIALLVFFLLLEHRRRRLSRILRLSLEFNPLKVHPGDNFDLVVNSQSQKTIRAALVEGDLICKRYNFPWQVFLDNAGIPTGQPLTIMRFSLGSDLMFVEGTTSSYGGQLPIPEEAFLTEKGEVLTIRWVASVRVHAAGYPSATVSRELPVIPQNEVREPTQEEIAAMGSKGLESYMQKKTNPRDNVILTVEGAPVAGESKEEQSKSRFAFLELEDDRKDNWKN